MDRFKIAVLRSYYGNLLTEIQNDYLRLHYDEDLSYGEMAEIIGISRQAVRDAINKGEKLLVAFENNLGFVARDQQIKNILDNIKTDDEEIKKDITEIKKILED